MTTQSNVTRTQPQPIEIRGVNPRAAAWTYRPAVDIVETPDELVLSADLPGADPDHIDIAVEGGVLTIQAGVEPRVKKDCRAIVNEYGVGGFHRRFEIDETIDTENIAAEFRNGELTVRLPKMPQARRRRIPVST